MITRRGLTLIEVLAATVLLAMIAAAATPLLQEAWRHLAEATPDELTLDLAELGAAADEVIEHPDRFGFGQEMPLHGIIPWPAHPERVPIEFGQVVSEPPSGGDHAWLRFSCGDAFVLRRVRLREADATGGPD